MRGIVVPAACATADEAQVLGIYCAGTYLEPVILIDLAAHRAVAEEIGLGPDELLAQVLATVEHEARHADQESQWDGEGDMFDEEDAEHGSFSIDTHRHERPHE